MNYPYTPPLFLQGQSADEIHRRMMSALPDDIDKSEGQIPWDFTRPAALEKAEMVQFILNETIKIMFKQWAYGEYLDLHAEGEGLSRREPNTASGTLLVKAKPGVIIPAGFQFATPAQGGGSIIFAASEQVEFLGLPDPAGVVTREIKIQAVSGGTRGNVPPDTIILMVNPIPGVTYISNPEATTGGTNLESDDDLRDRIIDAVRKGVSYTGCDSDYERWATEVPGVGSAITNAEWDGPGTVRLFIIDANGEPANEQIQEAVYNYIISPDDRLKRKAPIGALLTVAAPVPLSISVTADVVLAEGEELATVLARFTANLSEYWRKAASEYDVHSIQAGLATNSVKYVFVGAALADTTGVSNYSNLHLNGGMEDIVIPLGQYPVTQEVLLFE